MNNKNGLVLVAHGSRNTEANQQTADLASQLMLTCSEKYALINAGFLQFATPTIDDAVCAQIQSGIKNISVFPFFLGPGNHVTIDIPNSINQLQAQYPEVTLTILPAFGTASHMAEWITTLI